MQYIEKSPICPLNIERGQVGNNEYFMKREDLLPFSIGGNKVRIALEFLGDMRLKGANCMVMYGNSRSNLCRVLANLCYIEKIPCYMVCSSEESGEQIETANSRILNWLNVTIIPCLKTEIAHAVEETFSLIRSRGMIPYYIYGNQFGEGNEGTAASAYTKAYREILDQEKELKLKFDYIFHASGTGATQSGLICGHLLEGDERKIIGISVSRDKERGTRIIKNGVKEYFHDQNYDLPRGWEEQIFLDDSYLAGGYGQYNEQIAAMIKEQFRENGICLDPTYTGKAFWGMMEYIKREQICGKNILFLHTGGTPLFFDALEKMGSNV